MPPALLGAFHELISRYSEPHRKYHTVRHLDECFSRLDQIRLLAKRPAEVEVALWYHDAVYEQRSHENEARSAELAAATVRSAGKPAECAHRVCELILATRHAALPRDDDAKVLVDVDLSILGETPARFDEYERQVREEYSWVPELLYRKERRTILKEFLTRAAIFNTAPFRERYGSQARANIERSLQQLGG